MPIDSKHRLYQDRISDWRLIDDLLQGERAVKASGESYCPKLSGQTTKEYEDYIGRGAFYNAFARTVQGLAGAVTRKEPTVKVDKEIEDFLDDATLTGRKLVECLKAVVQAMIAYAGYGIMVDWDENAARPYLAFYRCQDVINWRYDDEGKLNLLVLSETYDKEIDEYSSEAIEQLRVYRMTDGAATCELYRRGAREKKFQLVEERPLAVLGRALDEIPFVFIGEDIGGIRPGKPPLYDLARLNIKHWQVSVDYYHGLHYCALPTPWAAGWPKTAELFIGSKKAWVTEDPNASCGFLEFTGQGLGAVEKAIDKIEKQMAVMGARLLEEQKKGVETAESLELRQSGDLATLGSIVTTIEAGMNKALDYLGMWTGKKTGGTVEMNRDFIAAALSPEQILALLQALQAGYLSQDTFLYNLSAGDILPPGRTIEDEKKLIESETPPPSKTGGGNSLFAPFGQGDGNGDAGGQGAQGGQLKQ
jgi:hypothetical protein